MAFSRSPAAARGLEFSQIGCEALRSLRSLRPFGAFDSFGAFDMIIYGINAVTEALRANRIRRIRVAGRDDNRLRTLLNDARSRDVRIDVVTRDALEREARGGVH